MTMCNEAKDCTATKLKNVINALPRTVAVVQIVPTSPLVQNDKTGEYTRDYLVIYKWN
jgi:hypothetical protein